MNAAAPHREYRREPPYSRTAVLFIHGICGSPDQFVRFYEKVPEDWAIVSLLLDGHGGSVRDFSRTSMSRWKQQTEREVERLALRYDRIVIAAHSMGTFFAMDAARRMPEKITALFLLAVPLIIFPRPRAAMMSMKVLFTRPPDADPMVASGRAAYSIEIDRRLWRYAGWIPRYLELFRESSVQRRKIAALSTECTAFQSARDEMVSRRSERYLAKSSAVKTMILSDSTHAYHAPDDLSLLLDEFAAMCGRIKG